MKERQAVLIVEDNWVNREILKKILKETYEVIEAENGGAAWEILSEKRSEVSAVLLDIVMPVMNGYELLAKIQEAHMEDMPVIVTTGATDREAEQKALEAGAWDFVTKPYNARVLLSRLRNAIARSEVSAYEKIQYVSEHDELTGLYNRGKMFAETRKMIDKHADMRFVFIRLDIDHFALFNTSFGVKEGDRLLKFLAQCIEEETSGHPICTYGRMNADVFCVCSCIGEDQEALERQINRIQKKLAAFRRDYRLEISVGVCIIENPSLSIEDSYFRASTAFQKCKNQIDTHLAFYDEATGKKIETEITITNEMQKALDEKQFVVYLQPKFNLSTERACGAEALVRWMHPVKGLVSPGEFIPVFEKNGFISKLDYYVWEQTCRMLQGWMAAGRTPYPVSVNISRISLYNPQLVDLMKELVEKYKIPPVLLQLEVTESAYMSNPELMEETIKQLHDAGFTILMDDFGSGSSSLNTLKRIQVDVLKVDMKFLPVKDETERGEIILASVIKMANWLGMSVVVEGVETRQQRDFLEGAGCDCVQGYYYARPVPQAEYEEKYLNAAVTEEMVSIQEDLAKDVGPHHNMTILVIDDSETDRALLEENFKDLYHMHMCESGEEGFAYLKRNRGKVRLILVDNVMPGMSGLEFLRCCQQDSTLSVIPKIMITANDSVADQVEAFKEGAYDYITKPLIMEVVAARINHVMAISCHTSVFDTGGAEYSKKANLDVETQLFNKMAFREFSTRVIDSFPDDTEALMVLDIDNFKQINDRYGHLEGDAVIRCVADELLSAFRNTDIVGRFGGDEFVVLMTRIPNMEIAKRKAAELVKNVLLTCTKQLNINASISIGLAFSEAGDTLDTLFARADQALYEAKNSGRAKVVVYGEEVPPIEDDDKPIVLVCGEDPQLYPTIALAYGTSAAFTSISSYSELVKAFENYGNRIRVICMDTEKKVMKDSDKFYQYILEHGGGVVIPILAVYREGSMEQLREAVELNVFDVFTLPPQMDVIQRRLSRAIMRAHANKDEH